MGGVSNYQGSSKTERTIRFKVLPTKMVNILVPGYFSRKRIENWVCSTSMASVSFKFLFLCLRKEMRYKIYEKMCIWVKVFFFLKIVNLNWKLLETISGFYEVFSSFLIIEFYNLKKYVVQTFLSLYIILSLGWKPKNFNQIESICLVFHQQVH